MDEQTRAEILRLLYEGNKFSESNLIPSIAKHLNISNDEVLDVILEDSRKRIDKLIGKIQTLKH